ncbi:MAG TPA: hypothetical protein VHM19_19920, partial [Polyangiales bacterium]|nr:hypothetical protein [Polyangiales bacterium]
MVRLFRLGWLTLVALGLALTALPARADDAEQRYQTTVEQAVHEFSLQNWAEARALFRRAHTLFPSARTFRGMGMAAFEMKMYVDAWRELNAALADTQRPLTAEQRTQVQSLIDQSRAYVGRYQVTLEPATAKPLVDGAEALFDPGNVLLLALGDHVVSASAEGYQEVKVPLKVEGGEDLVLKIQLAPANQPQPTPQAAPAPLPPPAPAAPVVKKHSGATTAGWVLAGTTVAFAGGSAVFWVIGSGKYDDLKKECGTSCSDKQVKDSGVKTSDTLTTVLLAAAGASAIASVICFAVGSSGGSSESAGKAEASGTTQLAVGPGSLQLQG